jgi:hypothetical protein
MYNRFSHVAHGFHLVLEVVCGLLGLSGNTSCSLQNFKNMVTDGSLGRKNKSIYTVHYRVRHIGSFGTGWTGVVDHGLEDLVRNQNWFAGYIGLCNHCVKWKYFSSDR